jgi:hypothetical protein
MTSKTRPRLRTKILADVLKMVNEKCLHDATEMFLLIDHVDIPLYAENAFGRQRFMRDLQQLCQEYETLRIIVTSQCQAQEMNAWPDEKNQIMEIWVDTTKPQPMYSRN